MTQAELLPFDGGPSERLQRSLGLIKPDDRRVARRALIVMAVGWVPLAVLAAAEGYALRSDPRESFLLDFGAYSRFLLAAPLLVVAESDCLPRLARIVRHFIEAELVASGDRARYEGAIASTTRLLNSGWAEVIVVAAAYGLTIAVQDSLAWSVIMRWQAPGGAGLGTLSLAGWWYILVSFPLMLVLLLGWLWRVLLWGRLLWILSRLELRLIAAHPDLVGGLKFLSGSARAFRLLGLAIGAAFAGPIANHVLYLGDSPLDYKYAVVALLVVVLAICVGPLLVFIPRLRGTKKQGLYDYGVLANELGRQFEKKWLKADREVGEDALAATDFSATTDLYGIVANVREMETVPIKPGGLYPVVGATLLPFVPVALMAMPFEELVKTLAKLLL